MIKQPITYTNFLGEEVTTAYNFHLTTIEIGKFQLKYKGLIQEITGLKQDLDDGYTPNMRQRWVDTTLSLFEELVERSFGIRSEDGIRFMHNGQSEEATEAFNTFRTCGAYDSLLLSLLTIPDNSAEEPMAVKFITQLITPPKK
jgi:hypothetical protein